MHAHEKPVTPLYIHAYRLQRRCDALSSKTCAPFSLSTSPYERIDACNGLGQSSSTHFYLPLLWADSRDGWSSTSHCSAVNQLAGVLWSAMYSPFFLVKRAILCMHAVGLASKANRHTYKFKGKTETNKVSTTTRPQCTTPGSLFHVISLCLPACPIVGWCVARK